VADQPKSPQPQQAAPPPPPPAQPPAPRPPAPPPAPAAQAPRERQEVRAADAGAVPPESLAPATFPPVEAPQPSEFRAQVPPRSDDRINVGDPRAALERLGQAHPMRSLDPARQPPAPRGGKVLKKGEVYWIVNAEDLDQPRRGKIVRLTRTPGKYVGVELEKPVGPHIVHDCDGAGKAGHCLYCRVDQVLTDDEYRVHLERHKAVRAMQPPLEDLDTLRLDVAPDGHHEIR
jgi:hypothetical protein